MAEQHISGSQDDGVDRRGFLKCMAWAGTGLLWSMSGGILKSATLQNIADQQAKGSSTDLFFIQISDSHIGFNKEANKDVTATLQEAIARINTMSTQPAFLLHTGDISHLSKPDEFDTADQIIKSARTQTGQIFYVPGEHDVLIDNGVQYLQRYGKGSKGGGWYSFDHSGVHFIGLVNVLNLKAGGLGNLGREQLEWLEKDVKRLSASTPIVVFAHIPLWTVYPEWGWGTDDGKQALSYLKRFGSVTVLNGHIHQTMQKIEGHVTFHTAMSTAFPQPKPGAAPSPGPMKVEADQLRNFLGLTSVHYVRGQHHLAVIDTPLSGISMEAPAEHEQNKQKNVEKQPNKVIIDNFSFSPQKLTVIVGTQVTWTNKDDSPHKIVSVKKYFASPAMDTDAQFSFIFNEPGTYDYYCTMHPQMKGKIIVRKE